MKLLFSITLALLIYYEGYTQDTNSMADILVSDFKTGVSTSFAFFTSPLSFSEDEWLFTATIASGSLLMFAFDEELETNHETYFDRHKWLNDIVINYGDVDFANIFSSSLYAAGLLSGNDDIRITGRLLLESLFIGGSSALMLRVVTGRPRPFTGESSGFNWFKTDWHHQSFPSGHMTVVFAVSTILAERINSVWSRAGFYGLAAFAGIERIYSNEHWFSDVIIGSLLGYGSAAFVLNRHENKDKEVRANAVSFFPSLNGMNLIWRF